MVLSVFQHSYRHVAAKDYKFYVKNGLFVLVNNLA